jgi:exopolysaccharide production protein ExoY
MSSIANQLSGTRAAPAASAAGWASDSPASRPRPIFDLVKRAFDIGFALLALSASALIFAAVALTIRLRGDGPVFFGHERVGKDGHTFHCLKFRTMVPDAEARLAELLARDPAARAEFARDRKLKDDPRVIPGIGKFLRQTSLDELPQFVNVLRGEMSVVGPRPVTSDEVLLYGRHVSDYLSVKPGVTGLWQVSGRNELTFAERVALDVRYVAERSFFSDTFIILRTVAVLATGHGAY